jgi:hypothetical protein
MTEPITTVEAAVAELGALPVPAGSPTQDDPVARDREILRAAPKSSDDWDDETWAAWWHTAERVNANRRTVTEYGIRFSDGSVLHSDSWCHRRERTEERLAAYQTECPAARLVQRTVHYGDWTEADQ